MITLFWSVFPIYLFSDLGEDVSNHFYELNDTIYQSEWYAFPIEVQRMLPILLMTTQKQVVPRGFGNLLCIRESFKKVTTSFLPLHVNVQVLITSEIPRDYSFSWNGLCSLLFLFWIFRLSTEDSRTLWCSVNSDLELIQFQIIVLINEDKIKTAFVLKKVGCV